MITKNEPVLMHVRKITGALCVLLFLAGGFQASAQYQDWKYNGSMYIITTPEGANLPAGASERDFPLLVRLHRDFFDFGQAKANGEDIRFSADGKALSYQVEEWDVAGGTASIWVRIPTLKGNSRQELKLHWGKPDSKSESNGKSVFNESNGYLAVWHMNAQVTNDEVGAIESEDAGTSSTKGMIGQARHFPGKKGVFCGDSITTFPTGSQPHSSAVWLRGEKQNCRILSWGKEQGQGKVQMWYRSPSHIRMDCYFSDGSVSGNPIIPLNKWVHVVHTYEKGESRIYVNGALDKEARSRGTPLNIPRPARMWIGGWYNNYDFIGDIDEVRISGVTRSPDWIRLQYENQKPLQTLAGPVIQQGNTFSVSKGELSILENQNAIVTAKAGGAQKIYWVLKQDNIENVVAVDRLSYRFDAGRVTGKASRVLQFKAVYADGVKIRDIPVTITEDIPEPVFSLQAPSKWNGRDRIEVVPLISNLKAMNDKGGGELSYKWTVSGGAVIKEALPDRLILRRSQYSGIIIVTLALDNGGTAITQTANITVKEPTKDPWVQRVPAEDEKPADNQFYARDDKNEGTLHCNGTLDQPTDSVFLRVYADDKLFIAGDQELKAAKTYAFAVKLKPGLIKYRVEFGSRTGGAEKILHRAGGIVCGDAYIIEGQSNALATDTREESPLVTNQWVYSYGRPRFFKEGERENLWCRPVWKAQKEHLAELGWWGMELASRLVESQNIPIFIVNGARGGTRIDQHQRNDDNPADLDTIYGRMLWRVQQARLTHGIRAIIWHQGENDQGAAGPDGGYGWETYQRYFVEMSADWKRDFPNVSRYYVFQIWPNSCSMGGGNGNMLREKQRTLPSLFSNMEILSTLGIRPGGPCHYPLKGWSEFALRIQSLLERDFYGKTMTRRITAPNLLRAVYASDTRKVIALKFDQPVVWTDALASEFYLDGIGGQIASGTAAADVLILTLKEPSQAKTMTYLDERRWSQDRLLVGENGIAALTFCNVPILLSESSTR